MAAEKCIGEGTGSTTIGDWSASLEVLHARIALRFARAELRERVRRYLNGLLGRVERKNGWQLAEVIGDAGPQGVQRLMNNAKWAPDLVRDDLREYVLEHLADEKSGLLIVDETGFLKKGEKSVGVARQYTGTAGETVNCQVGVFLAYSSEKGTAFVDRALYLPKEWTEDPARYAEAGIPQTVGFATRSSWQRGCSREPSRQTYRQSGSLRTPSTAGRTPSGTGSRNEDAPTRLWCRRPTPYVTRGVERRSTN
jgi:SRSO17 transposase